MGYDNYMQFVLNLASSIVSCAGALAGVALSDRMPRRKVLIIGTFLCSILLAINGGLSTRWGQFPAGDQNLSVGKGAVAAYFFFNIVYAFTYTPLQALYPVECLQTTARAKGMAMYGVVVNAFGFINQFAGPIALKNIQENYVYVSTVTSSRLTRPNNPLLQIFVGWDIVESVIWYFLAVETVGRSLEELEDVFSSPFPPKAEAKKKVVISEDGHIELLQNA